METATPWYRRLLRSPLALAAFLAAAAVLAGSGTAAAQPFGPDTFIDSTATQTNAVATANVDGDAEVEVVAAQSDSIVAYQIDGALSLPYERQTIGVASNDIADISVADVTGDGRPDVVAASEDYDGSIILYANDGGSGVSFSSSVLSSSVRYAESVHAADVDGDGNLDVLTAEGGEVVLHLNDGSSSPSFTRTVVSTAISDGTDVHAGDLDGDGDLDVVSSSQDDDTIAWYENDGTDQPSFARTVISSSARNAENVFVQDVNGDGAADVLASYEASYDVRNVVLYQNDGAAEPTFSGQQVDRFYTDGRSVRDLYATDVTGDGRADVIAAEQVLLLYTNAGGAMPRFSRQVAAADRAYSSDAADLNGDGDRELLFGVQEGVKVSQNARISPVVYVDPDATGDNNGSSWADAYTSLQPALPDTSASFTPVEIWVAGGVYKPDEGSGDREATFALADGVRLYGGFDGTDGSGGGAREGLREQRDDTPETNSTILAGDGGRTGFQGDNAYHVVTVASGATVRIDGFTIEKGFASASSPPNNSGAGVWAREGTLLYLQNARVRQNAASGSGGDGGGVDSRGSVVVSNATFANNSANDIAGAVYARDSVSVANTTFEENTAGEDGGAIFNSGSGTYTNVTFTNNEAGESGGAVSNYGYDTFSRFTDVQVEGNRAGYRGGGFYLRGEENRLTDVTFANNTADDVGGGMQGSGTFRNVEFVGNEAKFYGGGGLDGGGTLTDVRFENNTADERGGGMSGSGDLRRVVFVGNTSENGGGLWTSGSTSLARVTFARNESEDVGGGVLASGELRAFNVSFFGNTADRDNGGAVYLSNSGAPLANLVFSGNEAGGSGGGLFLTSNSSPAIVNVTFAGNSANQEGGALYSEGTNSFPTITNAIFWNNQAGATAGADGEIYAGSGEPLLSNAIVQGGIPSTVFNDGGVIDQDPQFVNASGPDNTVGTRDDSLQVASSSPAIDAGSRDALPSDVLDLDADSTTDEVLPVDRAGNARAQDVSGIAPDGSFAVDLGAYEASGQLPDALANGDVDGDDSITPNDASLALQAFLDLVSLDPTQERAADYNDDRTVSPFDASLILRAYLGKAGEARRLAKRSQDDGSAPRGTVRLGEPNIDGRTATVPVVLTEDAQNVASVALTLSIDPSTASVQSVETDLPDAWMARHNAKDDGTLKVGMAGSSTLSPGVIGRIRLAAKDAPKDITPEGHFRLNGGPETDLGGKALSTPDNFALKGNWPNPFDGETGIRYQLKEAANVRISIYDVMGRRIRVLVNEKQKAGEHTVRWDGRNNGRKVASGVYLYRLEAGGFTDTGRMVVVR
jgi:predicted outer membrane repeat protein